MKLTSDLIYGFSGSLLSPRFDEPAPTPDCHREWWDLCCSDYKRVAIAAPRGHAKSTAITKSYTLASVLFRDASFVLLVSDTYQQAVMFLAEIKREFEINEDLIKLFNIKGLETDREDDITVACNDGYRFKITAVGSEQKIRGRLWDGKRPDLIVGDDLENDEIVMNPERRDKFKKWFTNALLPTLSKKGKVRLVGTILHMDSLLEGFMPKERDSNCVVEDLKSYMKKPKNGWYGIRYAAHGPNAGFEKILWPIKWSEERLKEIQEMFEGQGNPEGYYQEYLNRPIDPRNAYFRKTDFTDFDEIDQKRGWEYAPTYLSIDVAFTVKERRDWCVFGIGSTDEKGMFYIRHVIRDRLDSKEVVDTILELRKLYGFNTLLLGKGALEKAIGPYLKEAIDATPHFIDIQPIPEIVDKRSRAQSIRARMRAGGVKFDKRKPWYSDFEQELLEFDRGPHDDQVDMMSLFGLFLESLWLAPSAKEIIDVEWDKEHPEFESLSLGRSEFTGY